MLVNTLETLRRTDSQALGQRAADRAQTLMEGQVGLTPGQLLARAEESKCISSDDPRLKTDPGPAHAFSDVMLRAAKIVFCREERGVAKAVLAGTSSDDPDSMMSLAVYAATGELQNELVMTQPEAANLLTAMLERYPAVGHVQSAGEILEACPVPDGDE